MATVTGDRETIFCGVGSQTAPSFAFADEEYTGTYLENPGPSSSYTVVKRGQKRIRIEDDKVDILVPLSVPEVDFDDVKADRIEVGDGSESAPSYTFTNSTSSGFYFEDSPSSLRIVKGGDTKISVEDSKIVFTEDIDLGLKSVTAGDVKSETFEGGDCNFGNIFCSSVTSNGDINAGTHAITAGPVHCASLIVDTSIQGGQVNVGNIFCNSITGTGPINIGANALTCGSLTTGTISSGNITTTGTINATGTITSNTTVTGSIISSGSQNRAPVGSAAIPSFSFTGQTTSGWYFNTTSTTISSTVNGTNKLSIGTSSITSTIPFGNITTGALSTGTNSATCSNILPQYGANLRRETALTIPDSTAVDIPFDAITGDQGFSPTLPLAHIPVPASGYYSISFSGLIDGTAFSGDGAVQLFVNGTPRVVDYLNLGAGFSSFGGSISSVYINQGQTVYLSIFQTTGADRFLQISGLQDVPCNLWIKRHTGSQDS